MPTSYTYATLTDGQDALLSRLYDNGVASQPVGNFWTRDECTTYIVEALRVWNAYTAFWRAEFPFDIDTVANHGSNWYDLTSQSGTLRPYTVTDQYLVNQIEYALLEPLTALSPSTGTPAAWTGSNQFSLNDILNAITRRQNECLSQTGCTASQALVAAAIQRRTYLSDSVLDVRRIAWLPTSGLGYSNVPLRQADIWEKQAFDVTWTQQGPSWPRQWMQSSEPPPSFDVDRIPAVPGNYDVLSVNAGPTANTTSAQALVIPDDWSWIVKWGALADLLSKEANAKDVMRAKYCQARFVQDCQLLSMSPAVLGLLCNGIPMFTDAVRNGDDFNPNWQAQAAGVPSRAYQAGLNLLGFPNPDGIYNIMASVVENAPVPSVGSDYIQVDRGDFDSIIDEAQHLAMFKCAGAEFEASIQLHQSFIAQAGLYNRKLREMGQFNPSMLEISQRNEKRNPRALPARR